MQGYTNCWTLPQPLSKNFFIRLKSDHCLALSVSHSITPCLLWDLMWPWRVKIHTTSPCLTSCCHWNKTKAILLMLDEKKVFCSCWNKTRCQKSDSTNFLAISDHFKRNFFVHQFVYCTQCLGSIVLSASLYNNCAKYSQIWQAEKPLWWNYHSTAEVNRR